MDTSFEPRHAHAARAAGGLIARIADVALISFGALAAALVLPGTDVDRSSELAAVACAATFALMLFPALRLYHAPARPARHRTALLIAFAWLIAQAGAALVMRVLAPTLAIPLPWYLLWTATSGIALVASRVVAGTTLERIGRPQESDRLVAIVGSGAHRDAVLDRIASVPSAGFRAAAMFDIARADTTSPGGMPRFRDLDTFAQHVRTHAIPEVWLALPIGEARIVVAGSYTHPTLPTIYPV